MYVFVNNLTRPNISIYTSISSVRAPLLPRRRLPGIHKYTFMYKYTY